MQSYKITKLKNNNLRLWPDHKLYKDNSDTLTLWELMFTQEVLLVQMAGHVSNSRLEEARIGSHVLTWQPREVRRIGGATRSFKAPPAWKLVGNHSMFHSSNHTPSIGEPHVKTFIFLLEISRQAQSRTVGWPQTGEDFRVWLTPLYTWMNLFIAPCVGDWNSHHFTG